MLIETMLEDSQTIVCALVYAVAYALVYVVSKTGLQKSTQAYCTIAPSISGIHELSVQHLPQRNISSNGRVSRKHESHTESTTLTASTSSLQFGLFFTLMTARRRTQS